MYVEFDIEGIWACMGDMDSNAYNVYLITIITYNSF